MRELSRLHGLHRVHDVDRVHDVSRMHGFHRVHDVDRVHDVSDRAGISHIGGIPGGQRLACYVCHLRRGGLLLALPATARTAPVTASVPGLAIAACLPVTVAWQSAARAGRRVINWLERNEHAAPVAVLARHGECLKQAGPDPLPGHLHQAERGDLGHLMLGPVPREALKQPPEHQIAVALQHHIDEVDDDDAAHVAQPELPDDLLGGFEVVAGYRLLQVAAMAGELARVDVDDRHGLGGVDHQRAAAGQPDLTVERLGDLLVNPVSGEDILIAVPPAQPLGQVRRDVADIVLHHVPLAVAGDDQAGEVLVEDIPDHPDRQVGLAVEQLGGGGGLRLLLDRLRLRGQPGDVLRQLFLGGTLGGRPDDHPGVLRHDLLQDLLEPGTLGVGQLAADPGHPRARHVNEIAAGQAHLAGEPGALVTDRVLGGLHEDRLARLERRLDALGFTFEPAGIEVDLAGVENGIPALADVDERGLHGRQHVLHLAEIDVADIGLVAGLVHVVLDKDAVLQHRDLGSLAVLPHDHDPVHRLPAGEELGLGDDRRAPPAGLAALAPPLPLGLQPGGTTEPLDVTG